MNTRQFATQFRRIPKFVTGLTLLAFVTLVFVGIFDCTNLIMQNQMTTDGPHQIMTDCVPNQNCGMNINQHIDIWQSMITTNLTANFFGLFAGLLMVGIITLFGIFVKISTTEISSPLSRYIYYERDHRESKLYNFLMRIFAAGILQPKLFA